MKWALEFVGGRDGEVTAELHEEGRIFATIGQRDGALGVDVRILNRDAAGELIGILQRYAETGTIVPPGLALWISPEGNRRWVTPPEPEPTPTIKPLEAKETPPEPERWAIAQVGRSAAEAWSWWEGACGRRGWPAGLGPQRSGHLSAMR